MSFLKKRTQTAIIIFHMLRSKQTCYKFVFLVIAGDVENEDRTVMRLKDLIGHLTVLLCLTSLCLSFYFFVGVFVFHIPECLCMEKEDTTRNSREIAYRSF